jgi:hypothetical protein
MAPNIDDRLWDWSHARVADPAPCRLCGRPALLRHPANDSPCHKVCADRAATGAPAERHAPAKGGRAYAARRR